MRPPTILLMGPVLAVLFCAAGCGEERPAASADGVGSANVSGGPIALYPIPASAPHGEVRVTTLGIATLQPSSELAGRLRALHVRLTVTNEDDRGAWELDTREQVGILDHFGRSRAAFASSTSGRPPLVTVVPGGSAVVDLFYPLPSAMQGASRVPLFEVLWAVRTPQKPVVERTRFEGTWLERATASGQFAWDWSVWHPGWYDPFWPDDSFDGSPALTPAFYKAPVIVAPPSQPMQ